MIGKASYLGGNVKAARAAYRRILKKDSIDAGALMNMGNIYVQDKDYDSALSLFQKRVNIKPKYVNAHTLLGYVYQKKEELNAAVEASKAVELKLLYSRKSQI